MLRSDILWFLPAILIALFQVKWIWARLPKFKEEDTLISGDLSFDELLNLNYLGALTYSILIIQLVFPLLPITGDLSYNLILKISGCGFILIGFTVSLLALKALGSNWTDMANFRIKKNQQLIASGIYSLIRHPIYLAVILELVGFELVANSWLWLVFLVFGPVVLLNQIKKEELLLERFFGTKFKEYKNRTKIFLPKIF